MLARATTRSWRRATMPKRHFSESRDSQGENHKSSDYLEIKQYMDRSIAEARRVANASRSSSRLTEDETVIATRALVLVRSIKIRLSRYDQRSTRASMIKQHEIASFLRFVESSVDALNKASLVLHDALLLDIGLPEKLLNDSFKFHAEHSEEFVKKKFTNMIFGCSLGLFESLPFDKKNQPYSEREATEIYRSMMPVLSTFQHTEHKTGNPIIEMIARDTYVSDVLSVDFGVDTNRLLPATVYKGNAATAADEYWIKLTNGRLPYKR